MLAESNKHMMVMQLQGIILSKLSVQLVATHHKKEEQNKAMKCISILQLLIATVKIVWSFHGFSTIDRATKVLTEVMKQSTLTI
mmetsp:Transcript_25808/g.63215  ORF Transcript_25808/g.63215 Transcript_25808/m.63215 type:complete len:84 (+) Transcript_25808:1574-1825(+)